MNDQHIDKAIAEHLAELIHAVRDDWDTRGILTAIAKVRDRPLAQTTIAAMLWALNPNAETPGGLALDGPHWHEARRRTMSDVDRLPSTVPWGEQCEVCGKDRIACENNRLDDDQHPFRANHEPAVRRACAERAARKDPEWSPSDKPYLPRHFRAQFESDIATGRATIAARQADIAAKTKAKEADRG